MNALWKCHNTPAAWHDNDCAMMAANFLLETTGIDYAANFRGKYNSALSAMRMVKKAGGVRKIITDAGFTEIKNGFARVGDVAVVCIYKKHEAIGIVTHNHKVVSAGGIVFSITDSTTIYRKN